MSYNLTDALYASIDRILTELRVCLPAKIETYDYSTRMASVSPLLKRVYKDGEEQNMPVITGVPVVVAHSSGASLTMPINSGDGCLLIFADRSLDRWLSQGGTVAPDDRRKHDISDAIAIVGLQPFTVSGPAKNNDDTALMYNGSGITINKDGKLDIGNSSLTILTVLSELMGLLEQALVPTTMGPQQLSTVAQITALKTKMESVLKGKL